MHFPKDASNNEIEPIQNEITLDIPLLKKVYVHLGWKNTLEEFENAIFKTLRRFEGRILNEPNSTKRERVRELKKIESATIRLLQSLDNLSNERLGTLNTELLGQLVLRASPHQASFPPETCVDNGFIDKILAANSDLLRSCRSLLASETSTQSGAASPMNKPLDGFIRDLADYFDINTEFCPVSGCYYDANTESYSGEFFEFVNKIAKAHLSQKEFHSSSALGKRTVRVMTGRSRKKDRDCQ